MFDVRAISHIFTGTTAGWATFAVVLVALIKVWPAIKAKVIEAKANEAAIADGQWKRLLEWIAKLEARIMALEDEVAKCHRERDDAFAEAAKWKAVAEGIGQNRTEVAVLLAAERLAEAERKKEGEGGQ